jgi:hypothetical protein
MGQWDFDITTLDDAGSLPYKPTLSRELATSRFAF